MTLVLIPAYEPDHQLIDLTARLIAEDFAVLIVDDGSGADYASVFDAVRPQATVLTHEKNRGKGAALKTGMRYIREHLPDCDTFITCDADGQHRPDDVKRVRDTLFKGHSFVLTVRTPRKGVPFRSKFGNSLSRFVYTMLTDRYLSDNQSGLRGFSRTHLDWLIAVEKDNYDYEMNMLYYAAKKGVVITTLSIESVYIGNNESSHFNPLQDTLRIYRSLFRRAAGTTTAFLFTELLVVIASLVLTYPYILLAVPCIGLIGFAGRVLLDKWIFFKNTRCRDQHKALLCSMLRYIVYTLGCALLWQWLPMMPLWALFNIVFFLFVPCRYLLCKYITILLHK